MFGKKKIENPFADWPKTKALKDGGLHIIGTYTHPGLEQMTKGIVVILGMAMTMLMMGSTGNPATGLFVAGFLALAWAAFLKQSLLSTFGKKLNIKIFPDRIELPGFLRPKTYSRKVPIEFRIEQHIKAFTERGSHRTYRDAMEVVMQYGEKRIALAEMPDKDIELARALVFRLQGACYNIDAALKALEEQQQLTNATESEFGPAKPVR